MRHIELLSPAKNLQAGIAAINAGADAVYIGASNFGARVAAGNPVEDIEALAKYAHRYFAKVYVTVNTLLLESELAEAEALINSLAAAGADGVIIQDLGILEMSLPKNLPLIASTQADCYSPERIRLLEHLGFSRVILARELSIEQIKRIAEKVSCELECFVFGALCVSRSGLCYMSRNVAAGSANRGSCSQMCRHQYSLSDEEGNVLCRNKYLLSLRDLNLENRIEELIDAGVSSFKIEGRLKDLTYTVNTTAYFRKIIDEILNSRAGGKYRKASSGTSAVNFIPDLHKTFNRGFSEFMFSGSASKLANFVSPKSVGELLGPISRISGKTLKIKTRKQISAGDGCCYERNGTLEGFRINTVDDDGTLHISEFPGVSIGTIIYRNADIAFEKEVSVPIQRSIDVKIAVSENGDGFVFSALDEDAVSVEIEVPAEKVVAKNPAAAVKCLEQLKKSGNTCFRVIEISGDFPYFLPFSKMNEIRRQLLELLLQKRISLHEKSRSRTHAISQFKPEEFNLPEAKYLNITNSLAEKFYQTRLDVVPELSPEVSGKFAGFPLMTSSYCLRNELGLCPRTNEEIKVASPLFINDNTHKYRIEFQCGVCGMKIFKSK